MNAECEAPWPSYVETFETLEMIGLTLFLYLLTLFQIHNINIHLNVCNINTLYI